MSRGLTARLLLLRRERLALFDPFDDFTALPSSLFQLTSLVSIFAMAVLFATEPVTVIAATVSPFIDTFTFFLVPSEISDIARPVAPSERAAPMHQVLPPRTIVSRSIGPFVNAMAFHLVILEAPLERALIVPVKRSRPMLLAIEEVALEDRSIG